MIRLKVIFFQMNANIQSDIMVIHDKYKANLNIQMVNIQKEKKKKRKLRGKIKERNTELISAIRFLITSQKKV